MWNYVLVSLSSSKAGHAAHWQNACSDFLTQQDIQIQAKLLHDKDKNYKHFPRTLVLRNSPTNPSNSNLAF